MADRRSLDDRKPSVGSHVPHHQAQGFADWKFAASARAMFVVFAPARFPIKPQAGALLGRAGILCSFGGSNFSQQRLRHFGIVTIPKGRRVDIQTARTAAVAVDHGQWTEGKNGNVRGGGQ